MLEAGVDRIEEKTRTITSYLTYLVEELLSGPPYCFRLGSPRDPRRRSGHVALERDSDAQRIAMALKARGVVPDFRPPDTIRLAPVALYTTYHDVFRSVETLRNVIESREHERQQRRAPLIP
jgi:kynureninase